MKDRWEILSELCNKIDARKVAEIGVSRGINAANWLQLCPKIEEMYLVDCNWSVFDIGLFSNLDTKKIIRTSAYSHHAIESVEDNLDLVFIDADHGYEAVIKDVQIWLPKIRKGGIICGHDFMEEDNPHTEVRKAIEYCMSQGILGAVTIEDDILENGKIKVWWVQK